ncbi:hypothetical protein G6L96_009040 [Agrobacterium tumefaciens]|uniref:hypothetical protein n=1 Tax=Agrobacterium tumefaciens TaxID=358 RepID=UPI0015738EBD|nr:hypothetical protein [Agrobacterium tumefaciens]WCK69936.1 hypothetical protein G6L96_009040 [Agrobacterium tumefaciens]
MGRIKSLFSGIGFLILGWILPMIVQTPPAWAQWALFGAGILVIVISAITGGKPKSGNALPSDSISVSMRDGNSIGHIGNQINGGREEDR